MSSLYEMQLGDRRIESPVWLAPMCGVGDRVFLEICRSIDPLSVLASEMVSANGLVNGGRHTTEMIDFENVTGPVMIQIFGHEESHLAQGCVMIEEAGADILSMNFGCPAKKIVKNCDGAALLRTPERIGELVSTCVRATRVPMVAKMRIGWDEQSRNYLTVARILEEAGAHAIAVHGRTREQGYSGEADWLAIKDIQKAVSIPVIGNGDIDSPETARKRLEQTGVAGIMVGRAAMGNPWMLQRIRHYLQHGELLPEPGVAERMAVAIRHVQALVDWRGERFGVVESRKHVAWYLGGIPHSAGLRKKVNQATTVAEMLSLLQEVAPVMAA
jgi:tRNA-dihydrouridine synthase B